MRGDRTLKEVSDSIGIDAQSLSRYEKGERIPNVDTAKDIATYYGVSLDALYGEWNEYPKDAVLFVCNRTGLSMATIEKLENLKSCVSSEVLNKLVESAILGELALYLKHIELETTEMLSPMQYQINPFQVTPADGLKQSARKAFEKILDYFDARVANRENWKQLREIAEKAQSDLIEKHIKKLPTIIKEYEAKKQETDRDEDDHDEYSLI